MEKEKSDWGGMVEYIGAPLRPGRVMEALFGLLSKYSSEGRMWSREKVGL